MIKKGEEMSREENLFIEKLFYSEKYNKFFILKELQNKEQILYFTNEYYCSFFDFLIQEKDINLVYLGNL